MHACMHACMHAFMHAFRHSCIPAFVRSLVHLFIPSFIHSFIHSFVRSFVRSFVHSFIHSFIHSCVGLFIHSLTQSFTDSVIHVLSLSRYPSVREELHTLAREWKPPEGVQEVPTHLSIWFLSAPFSGWSTGKPQRTSTLLLLLFVCVYVCLFLSFCETHGKLCVFAGLTLLFRHLRPSRWPAVALRRPPRCRYQPGKLGPITFRIGDKARLGEGKGLSESQLSSGLFPSFFSLSLLFFSLSIPFPFFFFGWPPH